MFADADWFQLLAALIFLIISAVAQGFQKRAQSRRRAGPSTGSDPLPTDDLPSPSRQPPIPPFVSPGVPDQWEAQLRRILQIPDAPPPETPPPRTPLESPAIPRTSRSSRPPAPSSTDEELFPGESSPTPHRPLATFDESASAQSRAAEAVSRADRHWASGGNLPSAAAAADRAAHLSDRVAARLRSALDRVDAPGTTPPSLPPHHQPRRLSSTPRVPFRTAFRDRALVRQAFVASLVFGPPKGLE